MSLDVMRYVKIADGKMILFSKKNLTHAGANKMTLSEAKKAYAEGRKVNQ